jgi:DNA polymerase-3 subunit epsilon
MSLTRVALADEQVSEAEYHDLVTVAVLLGLGEQTVRPTLDRAWNEMHQSPASIAEPPASSASTFQLAQGAMVVFTGEMLRPRGELEFIALKAGLIPHPAVTKKVAVVVAADPDSLSGKAKKAAEYGIPIITEEAFIRLLADMR